MNFNDQNNISEFECVFKLRLKGVLLVMGVATFFKIVK